MCECVTVGAGLWFVFKSEEVTGHCRRCRGKDLHGVNLPTSSIRVLKSRRKRW